MEQSTAQEALFETLENLKENLVNINQKLLKVRAAQDDLAKTQVITDKLHSTIASGPARVYHALDDSRRIVFDPPTVTPSLGSAPSEPVTKGAAVTSAVSEGGAPVSSLSAPVTAVAPERAERAAAARRPSAPVTAVVPERAERAAAARRPSAPVTSVVSERVASVRRPSAPATFAVSEGGTPTSSLSAPVTSVVSERAETVASVRRPSAPVTSVVSAGEATPGHSHSTPTPAPEPPNWLVESLTAAGITPEEVQQCIRVLMGEQGFSDAERLGQFNQAYLTKVGISDMRVQLLLLKLHRKLRDAEPTTKIVESEQKTPPAEPEPGCSECCSIS